MAGGATGTSRPDWYQYRRPPTSHPIARAKQEEDRPNDRQDQPIVHGTGTPMTNPITTKISPRMITSHLQVIGRPSRAQFADRKDVSASAE
jgi:hypothetical protein